MFFDHNYTLDNAFKTSFSLAEFELSHMPIFAPNFKDGDKLIDQIESDKITEEWVSQDLLTSIYLNGEPSTLDIPPFRELKKRSIDHFLPEAPSLCLMSQANSLADQIMHIMLSKEVFRGKQKIVAPFIQHLKEKIQFLIDYHQPIHFVFPFLAFKDQSPFGTNARIDHTDLGEYCFFAQIKRILSAIQTIYSPGAHLTILCDGYIYADIFVNDDKDGAGRYKSKCEQIKNAYDLYNEVSLIDMREILFQLPCWQDIRQTIQAHVWKLYHKDHMVKQKLDFLAKRFIFYTKLPDCSYEQARTLCASDSYPKWIWDTLIDSAIKYASIHLTLKKTNLIQNAFPFSLRATVHPKPAAQFPLHPGNYKNDLLPYNGVPIVSRQSVGRDKLLFEVFKIQRLCDVLKNKHVQAVYLHGDTDPFYYELL